MNSKNTHFPQYRKLFNDKSFFKIIDERNFLEIQVVGKKYVLYTFKADQYFEILKVQEVLDQNNPLYHSLSEEEFIYVEQQSFL